MKKQQDRQPVWKRPKDAIRIFGISQATLYRWINEETVRSMKIEGIRFVDVSGFVFLWEGIAPANVEELERCVAQRGEEAKKYEGGGTDAR